MVSDRYIKWLLVMTYLKLSTLGEIFGRRHLFLFFPENKIWHFMQIVSSGNNLHEMSNPVFLEKNKKKCHQCVICWISPEGV